MKNYIYRTAEHYDYDRIFKFLEEHFYHEEPSIRATKTSIDEWLPVFEEMVVRSLKMPISTIVTTEKDDTVVGVLLNSVWERAEDEQKERAPDHEIDGYSETMQIFLTASQICHDEFWSLVPSDIKNVIYREISSVGKPWQRRGIASKMLARNVRSAKVLGIDGIVSITSSFANQILLAKHGFECLKEFPYSSIVSGNGDKLVETDDGSKGMKINFKIIERNE